MSAIENRNLVNSSNLSTHYGLLAGAMMVGILMLFQVSGNDFSPFLKLSKYITLAIPIVLALNVYKDRISGDIFIKGISVGLKLSLVAGMVLVLTNIVLYLISPEYAFSKYSIEPSTLQQLALVCAVLLFETIVFGGIITFAVLQYLKGSITR